MKNNIDILRIFRYNKHRRRKRQAFGPVVQLVRTLACHARGRGFEPHPGRQFAAIAQQVEHILGKDEVVRSSRISSSKSPLVFRWAFCFIQS